MPSKRKPAAQDETMAVYAHLIFGEERTLNAAKAQRAKVIKEAEARGLNHGDMRSALKLYSESPREREARAERIGKMFKALHVPGVQLELFPGFKPKSENAEKRAHDEGYFAGVRGEGLTCPYTEGTREGQAWLTGESMFQEHKVAVLAERAKKAANPEHVPAEPGGEQNVEIWPDDIAAEKNKLKAGAATISPELADALAL